MKNIVYEIKKLEGFVLGVGNFKTKLLEEVLKNDKIAFTILTNDALRNGTSNNIKTSKKSKRLKKISIKKLKKSFRRNKPDYMIIDVVEINDYLKYFVKDSLYITKCKLYIYTSDKDINLDNIYELYKRYNKDITYDKKCIIINNTNYKNNLLKNILYFIKDTVLSIYNIISNVITS